MHLDFAPLTRALAQIPRRRLFGQVAAVDGGTVGVAGLQAHAGIGDLVEITQRSGANIGGEVVALRQDGLRVMTYGAADGLGIGDRVELIAEHGAAPDESWLGRMVDAFGKPLDGRPLFDGAQSASLRAAPPAAASRKGLGARLSTGLALFNTLLPIARGQRLGVFAGSGVGKSTLLGALARGIEADVVVYALIGERGRELREFTEQVLGPEGMARAVVVAATSDQSPLVKRRAAWMAMAVAECFRDQGRHVLLITDSITRFAEAHREVALSAGETPSLRAFPPSTANLIAHLAERAGPGPAGMGDITAIFSVLVAGSDMEEPVADITRGVLDGHIVLDREIAERGRFPAVDVRRSVSRALPAIASKAENEVLARARRITATYENAAPMIQAGLYSPGADPALDEAIRFYPKLDEFFTMQATEGVAMSYLDLAQRLNMRPPAG